MGFRLFLDGIPLWATFLGTAALILASWVVGVRLGRRGRRDGEAGESLEGEIVAATLGLLAFLLAFTFGMASERYIARRTAVLDEALLIRSAYLRAGLVDEPHRSDVRALLREYLDVRLEAVATGNLEAGLRRSVELHDQMWSHAVAMRASMPNDIGAMAIEAVNEVITSHVRRVALALGARVPDAIWLALYGLTAISMLMVGHHGGSKGDRQPFGMVALSIAFALVILLIDALDRPRETLLGVSQRPLVELRAWMDSTTAP